MSTGENTVIDLDEDRLAVLTADVGSADDGSGAAVVNEDGELGGGLPKRAVRNKDGSITLPLLYPVTIVIRSAQRGDRTEEYKTLTFHRLVGVDLRAIQAASAASQGAVTFARSTKIRDVVMNAVFDKMDAADIDDASAVIESFLPSGRKTGRST